MYKNILKKQLEAGNYLKEEGLDPTSKYKYSLDDYDIVSDDVMQNLKNQSFKPKKFEEKILSVFGIKANKYLVSIVLDSYCPPNDLLFYTSDDGSGIMSSYKPLQIDFKRKALLEAFYIPEIIDYQKNYLDLFEEEKKMSRKLLLDGTSYTIHKWMDNSDLSQKREKNIQTLVNRNKYLFNYSKASLVWLKFNDQEFLESLVKTFGYVQDKDLLKWVLDKNLKNDEFDKLLFTRTCDNKFVFHKEIFEVMAQADAIGKENYVQYLLARIDLPKVDDLSFSDATKIKALYCYYATKFMGSIESSSIYSFFSKLQEEKYEDEFRKNNYYNLPDFKELYNDTKYGGIGLPE
jgi:hypothetical protein